MRNACSNAVGFLCVVALLQLSVDARATPDWEESAGSTPSFARDIRPILSNNCFDCHGPDEDVREADLRLDQPGQAFRDLGGYAAVVPGRPMESELYLRISDPDDPMPPVESGKKLTVEDIERIREWIAAGALWEEHWAHKTPLRPAVPELADTSWPRNAIDHFVLQHLQQEGLEPEPEAGKEALIRRLSLDLTGLPPTLAEIDTFLNDESTDAYERLVDRLLGSPRYGEHMARAWLDAARYGDTHGFHLDNERLIWPYRDWVIAALNDNLPFDRFTIEQLAGDLLPDPTLEQLVATGFIRLNPTTAEGGFIEEEYLAKYAAERVGTMGTVWLGTTMVCAQCHDHKYDPISQREFYELFAFFNNTAEAASDGNQPSPEPTVKVPSSEQLAMRAAFADQVAQILARLEEPFPEIDARQSEWEAHWRARSASRWTVLKPRAFATRDGTQLTYLEDGSILAGSENPARDMYEVIAHTGLPRITALRLEALPHPTFPHGAAGRAANGNFVLTQFELEAASGARPSAFQRIPLVAADADHSQTDWPIANALDGDPQTGWATLPKLDRRTAVFATLDPVGDEEGSLLRIRLGFDSVHTGHSIGRFRLWVSSDPELRPARFGSWFSLGPFPTEENGELAFDQDYGIEGAQIDVTAGSGEEQSWVERPEWGDGTIHSLEGEICATYLYRTIDAPQEREVILALGSDDALKVWCNGELLLSERVARGASRDQNRVTLQLQAGENELLIKVVNFGGEYAFVTEVVDEDLAGLPQEIARILDPNHSPSSDDRLELRRTFRRLHSSEYREVQDELNTTRARADALEEEIPTTLVAKEQDEVRPAHVLIRGSYAHKGEEVSPDTPAFLPRLSREGEGRMSRMDLALWLVDGDHPLTARVTVNRLWQELFGVGLVKTAEDFGSRGEFPIHSELLDHLALEFSERGWDTKRLLRQIVASATYRQDSKTSDAKRVHDPENRLLARGPRFRLDAERIRDSILAVSGLLVNKVGGPSVRPYQPDGIWEAVGYSSSNTARYTRQTGDALYRRSLYSFWKRTAPQASMQIFDAPSREACIVSRARTNTPLQALALLNDTQCIEAARAFAITLLEEDVADDRERLIRGFRRATARYPSTSELAVLSKLLETEREEFAANEEGATHLTRVGDSTLSSDSEVAELAAWTIVCNLLFNLDEFVNKE
ncbi:MAG: hypothetical protein CMJ89_08005 [Planctomycetes bacterium]|jgi:hypothetical protein|nr:hypothetical protein [Planctomycetota bacterium]